MSLPPLPKNFASAVDLSSLGKPATEAIATPGIAVNQENLIAEILPASNQKVVILICWSPRSAQAISLLEVVGKYHEADLLENGEPAWILGTVNVDTEVQVAQALQIQSVPSGACGVFSYAKDRENTVVGDQYCYQRNSG